MILFINIRQTLGFSAKKVAAPIPQMGRGVLDPIDGTINFLHRLPLCAVSLSLMHNDITLLGVIGMSFLGGNTTHR